jgi:hypothetical protein
MRSDNDRYITIIWANIIKEYEDNFKPMPSKYSDFGQYCYGSIMHYPKVGGFSKNGKPTILPKDSRARIGQRDGLAKCDIQLIEAKYRAEYAKR